ncbi:DUF6873 family GME fold protein [Peptoniphilus gorbachii]|uniref:DUF6873 domain-containing protein n=1 Tax=Peptoniphilus gorbachii TaxID=411567 RepID=A0ABS2MJH9_9FIRM|nr:hypothetical protein [Peptoniphilus gorbachii]MBM7550177.1 hypothetical protein [Peptoniphilus gorbachii]MDU1582771.1 hypothetical protein [Peptoniphilus harei]MDU1663287.1 hypothetical protein [Peptoniphilus harei]
MTYILVAENLPEEFCEKLKAYGEVVRTRANKNILKGLDTHTDILVHPLPSGELVVDRDNFEYYKNLFPDKKILPSHSILSKEYPKDVPLNAFTFKNYFIHNLKYTDKVLLDYYKNSGYHMIDIKQGYTKCSSLVTDDFVITSDGGIYESLKDFIPIYKIKHGEIRLQNFNYGFIGGASGVYGKKIFFTGDLSHHSSYEEILKIIKKYDYEIEILSKYPIEDFGSIYFI